MKFERRHGHEHVGRERERGRAIASCTFPQAITNEAAGATLWRVSLFLAIHSSSEMTQGRKTRDLLVASAAAPPVQSSKKCRLMRYEVLDECFTILLFHQWKTSKLSIPLLRARLGDVRIGASSLRGDKLVAPAGSRKQREPNGVQNDSGTGGVLYCCLNRSTLEIGRTKYGLLQQKKRRYNSPASMLSQDLRRAAR